MIIECKDYERLCDYTWEEGQGEPEAGLLHVNIEHVQAFFKEITNNGKKYAIVSPCSDFGLAFQAEHPPWKDMVKWFKMQASPKIGYNNVNIERRCHVDKCRPDDPLSIKCYSFTTHTLGGVPSNVLSWYMVNPLVTHPSIHPIPFGLAEGSRKAVETTLRVIDKQKLLYVNWQNNTWERAELKEYLRGLRQDWITIVDEPVSQRQYLMDLAEHKFVLCPNGNGVDCYRTWEAIGVGSIPIVEPSPATSAFIQQYRLPIMVCPDFKGITKDVLNGISCDKVMNDGSLEYMTLEYWENYFREIRKLLFK